MAAEGQLIAAGRTDTGRKRPHNEDAIELLPDLGLLVLADGMGGYSAGEVASRIAVETVVQTVRNASPLERGDRVLEEAVAKANRSILEQSEKDPDRKGMGTTLVACLFRRRRITVAHVGDSRAYRLRRGRFKQLTTDHSLNQELLDRGYYTRLEARQAKNRHVITRALGVGPSVEASIQEESVAEGDIFLLCSDGLTDMVDDHSIRYALEVSEGNLQSRVDQLVSRANELGGRDNISVILAQAGEPLEGIQRSPLLQMAKRLSSWLRHSNAKQ